jgi:serine-type D-Ala-D-Ala carboxypeptidase (penicillin-binding protein 5/6)
VTLDGKVIHSADLVALQEVAEAGFMRRMWDGLRLFFYGLFN